MRSSMMPGSTMWGSTMRRPLLMLAIATLALAGCAKKPPKLLPPPPLDSAAGAGGGTGTGDTTNGAAPGGGAPGSQGDFVRSVVADRIFFATDSSEVDADGQAALRSQATWLARYPDKRVTVEGHADERGTREYNLALGERRANAAKNALAALGVASARITTISYGKERPDATGSDESAWAKNRRAVTVTAE